MKTAQHGRTFSAEIRFGKCLPHIEQTSLRHRGVSTSRLPGSGFPEPLLMLAFNIGENGRRVKSLRMPGAAPLRLCLSTDDTDGFRGTLYKDYENAPLIFYSC
jgi:hypothetical protein